jgi:hypothetical protein
VNRQNILDELNGNLIYCWKENNLRVIHRFLRFVPEYINIHFTSTRGLLESVSLTW